MKQQLLPLQLYGQIFTHVILNLWYFTAFLGSLDTVSPIWPRVNMLHYTHSHSPLQGRHLQALHKLCSESRAPELVLPAPHWRLLIALRGGEPVNLTGLVRPPSFFHIDGEESSSSSLHNNTGAIKGQGEATEAGGVDSNPVISSSSTQSFESDIDDLERAVSEKQERDRRAQRLAKKTAAAKEGLTDYDEDEEGEEDKEDEDDKEVDDEGVGLGDEKAASYWMGTKYTPPRS